MRLSPVLCLFSVLATTFWSDASPPPGYYLTWSDEFSGTSLSTNWDYRNGSSSAPVSVSNGYAVIALYSDTNGPNGGTEISTEKSFSPTYGYFETSMQSPTTAGAFPAFWLQSPTVGTTNNNPAVNGTEIDIIENAPYTSYADNALHWNGYTSGIEQSAANTFSSPAPVAAFHTYGLLWTPSSYTFYVDGTQIWQTAQAVSQRSEYIILNIGINKYLAGTPPSGGYGSLSDTSTKVYFDYVRYYAPSLNVTWDANTSISGAQDGGGYWDSASWWNGTNDASWNDAVPGAATFGAGGTAGTVFFLLPHTVTSLTFNPVSSGSYTLTGAKTLTINGGITANASAALGVPVILGTSQTWAVLANVNLTISGVIGDGGAGYNLAKSGAGSLTLSGANTYAGSTTIANGAGTLAFTGNGSISNSVMINIQTNATLNVSAVNGFTLDANQTLAATGTNESIIGNVNVKGPLALTYLASTPTLNEFNGTLTLNNNAVTVSVTDGALSAGRYKLIAKQAGGAVAGTVTSSVLTISGAGLVAGNFGSVQISGSELYLNVQAWQSPVITGVATPRAGAFALNFSGANGQSYRVLASPSLLWPLTNWLVLTQATFGVGATNFTVAAATNAERFYRVASP